MKKKQQQLRSIKRSAKASMRKRVNKQMKHSIRKMREVAKNHKDTPISGAPLSELKSYELDDEVTAPVCDGVGDCCINTGVVVDPADLYRILHNEKVREVFGVTTTQDLFRGEATPLLRYWIDKEAGVPICTIRRDTLEDGNQQCTLLVEDENGKKSCLLGADKPTVCKLNPVRRIASKDAVGRMSGWKFVQNDKPCEICNQWDGKECNQFRIKDKIEELEVDKRYEQADLYHGFCGWMAKNIKAEDLKKLSAMLLFDFDTFSMQVGGLSEEDAIKASPVAPESVLVGARAIIGEILNPTMVPTTVKSTEPSLVDLEKKMEEQPEAEKKE